MNLGEAAAQELPVVGTLRELLEEYAEADRLRPTRFDRRTDLAERRRDFVEEESAFVEAVAPPLALWRAALRRQVTTRKLHGRDASPELILKLKVPRAAFAKVRSAIGARLRAAWQRARDGAEREVESLRAKARQAEPPPQAFVKPQALAFLRAKSFWVTGVIEDDVLKAARAVLFTGIKEDRALGATLFELDQALGDLLPVVDKAGRIVNLPHRLETIARTNIVEAINEGRMSAFNDPDLEGFVTGFAYSAILDDRVRPNHAALHGLAFKKGDPLLAQVTPPNGFNCRCLMLPITINDGEQDWVQRLPAGAGPDAGFK